MQPDSQLNYKAAKAKLAQDVIGFCKTNLPNGSVKGSWWLARVPWRADKTPSLGVHLISGNWCDFGRDGDRGDIIDLAQRLWKRPAVEIVREITHD